MEKRHPASGLTAEETHRGAPDKPRLRILAGPLRRSVTVGGSHDAQLRPVLLCLKDCRLPLARKIFESAGLKQRVVQLPALKSAQL